MFKDIIVNLTVDATHDATADYAISVARTFEAYVAGISFRIRAGSPARCSAVSPLS